MARKANKRTSKNSRTSNQSGSRESAKKTTKATSPGKKAASTTTSAKKATAKRPAAKKTSIKTKTSVARSAASGRYVSKATGRRTTRPSDARIEVPNVGSVGVLQAKAANVVRHLGGPTSVARVLQVAKSQPGRWAQGLETPSADSARHVLDLDYVLSRLEQVYGSNTAHVWLTSPNAFLGGARPIDVLMLDGPSAVIEAIDAAVSGSYA